MARTVVGLFDSFSDAHAVVNELESAGFNRDRISIVAHETAHGYREMTAHDPGVGERVSHGVGDAVKGAVKGGVIGGLTGLAASLALAAIPGVGPVLAAGPIAATLGGAGLGATTGGIIGGLTGLGVPEDEAGHYSEGIRRGGTLVTAIVDDNRTDEALAIFNRHDVVDIDERASYWRSSGYTGYNASSKPFTSEDIHRDRESWSAYRSNNTGMSSAGTAPASTVGMTDANTRAGAATPGTTAAAPMSTMDTASSMNAGTQTVHSGQQVRVPIIEEQVAVGKREVQRGGARIHTHVTETPVHEQVTLREEHVTVERHPVDRPVSAMDATEALRDRTIEVTERSEEAVVGKEARVVEEVVVGKEASQRTETVNETVRRTQVDVEELDADDTIPSSRDTATSSTTRRSV